MILNGFAGTFDIQIDKQKQNRKFNMKQYQTECHTNWFKAAF